MSVIDSIFVQLKSELSLCLLDLHVRFVCLDAILAGDNKNVAQAEFIDVKLVCECGQFVYLRIHWDEQRKRIEVINQLLERDVRDLVVELVEPEHDLIHV